MLLIYESERTVKIIEKRFGYKYKDVVNIEDHRKQMEKDGFERISRKEEGDGYTILYRKTEEVK